MENRPYSARSTDPETSHEAARLLQADKLTLRALEFLALNDRPEGWTMYELLPVPDRTLGLCPWHRITDLRQAGLAAWVLKDDGKMLRRPGQTSRTQGATRITDKGRQLYRLLAHHAKESNA